MAQKRMLSKSFFSSHTIAALPLSARYTFTGLWCYCDDQGRAEDDVLLIKAAVWPLDRGYTEGKIAKDLLAIEAAGLICRYQVNGFPLLHCPSWHEHQKLSHPATPRLPPCDLHECEAAALFNAGQFENISAKFRRASGGLPERLRAVEVSLDQSSSGGRRTHCPEHHLELPCRSCRADEKARLA